LWRADRDRAPEKGSTVIKEQFDQSWRGLIANGGKPTKITAAPDVFKQYMDELVVLYRERAGTILATPAPLKYKNLDVWSDATVPSGTFYMQ
jgi:hypothetical protein